MGAGAFLQIRLATLWPVAWPPDPTARSRAHCVRRRPAAARAGRRGRTVLDGAACAVDRRGDALHGLAIAPVGHAFAAAHAAVLRNGAKDHLGLGLGAARNGESAGNRKSFGSDRKDTAHDYCSPQALTGPAANRQARRGGLRVRHVDQPPQGCKQGGCRRGTHAADRARRARRRPSCGAEGQLDDTPGSGDRLDHPQDRKEQGDQKLDARSFGCRQDRHRWRMADRTAAFRHGARGVEPVVAGGSKAAAILLGAVEEAARRDGDSLPSPSEHR